MKCFRVGVPIGVLYIIVARDTFQPQPRKVVSCLADLKTKIYREYLCHKDIEQLRFENIIEDIHRTVKLSLGDVDLVDVIAYCRNGCSIELIPV